MNYPVSLIVLIITLLFGCSSRRKLGSKQVLIKEPEEFSKVISDSTVEPGYDRAQRALYWYLMSLSEEKRQEWINGTYSAKEVNNLIDTISNKKYISLDTLKK